MTTSYAPSTDIARSVAPIGVGVGLVAAAATTAFAHDWPEVITMVALIVVVTGLVFGVVVPRALRKDSAGGTALGLAVPAALLTLPAFWSGMPLVLGAAAMVVGNAGRTARSGAGKCIAGFVLGTLAVLGYLAIYAYSLAAGDTGFLFD